MAKRTRKALALMIAGTVAAGLGIAAPLGATEDEAASADAQQYAVSQGISLQEAEYRLALEEPIAKLRLSMEAAEESSFGGLYIDHRPAYRIVVQYVGTPTLLEPYIAASHLESLITLEQVEFTQAQLEQDITQIGAALGDGAYALEVDLRRNRVDVEALSKDSVLSLAKDRGVKLPATAEILSVPDLPSPALNLYGGLALSDCTSGFTIYKTSVSNRMITTAGHCQNAETYAGNALTYQNDEVRAGNFDSQSHKFAGALYPNLITTGGGVTRTITAVKYRAQQNVGNYVCKYGKVTGYGCGYIVSKSVLACGGSDTAYTAIKVDSDPSGTGYDLAEGGDSGGPWFYVHTAYGTLSCQQGFDAIYVATDYVEAGLLAHILVAP
jgi:hypothetical protein